MANYERKIFDDAEAKNCVGTSDHRAPRSGGWIELWEEVTGRTRNKCAFLGCSNDAEVGGHVLIKRRKKQFIIAICYSCNNSKPEYIGLKKNTACVEITPSSIDLN